MSVSHATPAPTSDSGAASLLRWVSGSLATAAVLAGLVLALWPASEADKARDDGEQFGDAVVQLYNADTQAEVEAALVEVDRAVTDTREHAGDEVASQVDEQADASTAPPMASSAPTPPTMPSRPSSTRLSSTWLSTT